MKIFFAYASQPAQVGQIIETALTKTNAYAEKVKSWKALNVIGSFIASNIIETIEESEIIIADITALNFNVTYEVGYAIGCGKKLLLVRNESVAPIEPTIDQVGIFDTIGYTTYSNSDDLVKLVSNPNPNSLFGDTLNTNIKAPIYILEQKFKTDFATRITARIKKGGFTYRSFDPNEMPRLSAYDAINQVRQSYGILVSLLSKETSSSNVHNIRAAFIAGLAHGMGKATCILQHGDDPVPIDFRDFVNVYYNLSDIDRHIADFAAKVAEAFQEGKDVMFEREITTLQRLDFGSSSAENEMRTLQSYYLRTDAFNRAFRGEVQLVVGRKGSGKSAIFLQIRDKERSKGNNVVLDLKPEGYKLIKFKELILSYLQEGTFHHTIIAFWEYILLLEICHRALENDKKRYLNNSELFRPYRELEESYKAESYLTEGDFSERMSRLMDDLTKSYKSTYGEDKHVRLSAAEITSLLYKSDINLLREKLTSYLKHKDKVWLLFDNIDKGWPSSGLEHEDFIIIRTLIDAVRSIQRQLSKERIEMYPVVFLRNDVYELLVEKTSDRQKEAKELIDWVDSDLLREVIRLRIASSLNMDTLDFSSIWRQICLTHYKGEETSQYLIERCLMRPRFLINLISQCKGFAVNLNHSRIEEEDIEKGFKAYSTDLLTDISYEIRDVLPDAENVLYLFIGSKCDLNELELNQILSEQISEKDKTEKIVDLLLWYGFLGVKTSDSDTMYIYNFNYNMKLLKGYITKFNSQVIFVINPAFWPSLLIRD
jgi:hypothetical protein